MAKSAAMLKFERLMSDLQARIGEPPLTSLPAISQARAQIYADTLPRMTEEERAYVREIELRAHDHAARMSAERGKPIPGSDPERPN